MPISWQASSQRGWERGERKLSQSDDDGLSDSGQMGKICSTVVWLRFGFKSSALKLEESALEIC